MPVVDVAETRRTAADLAAFGADVRTVAVIGDDDAGPTLRESLRQAGAR
ncbi:hypothetical protein AB0H20_27920 [Nocardia fluminea]